MSALVRVSAVSFLNTAPFIYGLKHSSIHSSINLSLDYPAECSRKLIANEADIGLVPVASLLNLPKYSIISDYCLGSLGNVRSVSLLSNSPVEKINTILLDFQSNSSNLLTRILAKHLWKREFEWISGTSTPLVKDLSSNQGMVAIGDKVFSLEGSFKYNYDLATEWKRFTSMPFVFAVWAASKELPKDFSQLFNNSLKYGLEHIPDAIKEYPTSVVSQKDFFKYLTQNISYSLDDQKKKALHLFLQLGKDFSPG